MNELIGQQRVYQDADHYNVLRFTESGRRVLFREDQFFIIETSAVDKPFFNQLKKLRTEIAREKGLPPYMVFSDKTLSEMVRIKPETNEELLAVSGVGE